MIIKQCILRTQFNVNIAHMSEMRPAKLYSFKRDLKMATQFAFMKQNISKDRASHRQGTVPIRFKLIFWYT